MIGEMALGKTWRYMIRMLEIPMECAASMYWFSRIASAWLRMSRA